MAGDLELEHRIAQRQLEEAALRVRRDLVTGEADPKDLARLEATQDVVIMTRPHSITPVGPKAKAAGAEADSGPDTSESGKS